MTKRRTVTVLVQEYHRGGGERNTCIIQLYLIWDQLLSPLPLLVSRRHNGTCQNKGSEIRLEQSWAGHLGGRLSISHSACCLLHSHSCTHTLPLWLTVCESATACYMCVCVCVRETPHNPSNLHVTRILQRNGRCIATAKICHKGSFDVGLTNV